MIGLARRYPEARLVFTGGSGDVFDQQNKEADFVAPFLRQLGFDASRVVFENRSRNTVENARLTYDLLRPGDGETWLLVTSAFHMPRAMGSFRQAGWTITAYPVDFATPPELEFRLRFDFLAGLSRLNQAVHECLGLLFYWVSGRSDAVFPGP